MAPKPKKPRTPKKGVKTKNKRKAQLPPDPVSPDGFVTEDESELTLKCKDFLNAIGSLATCVTADESRIAHGPAPMACPYGRDGVTSS